MFIKAPLRREILTCQNEYINGTIDKSKYFSNCADLIFSTLKAEFKEDVLYTDIFGFSLDGEGFISLPSEFHYEKYFKPEMVSMYKQSKNIVNTTKDFITMTGFMMESSVYGVLLTNDEHSPIPENFANFNTNKIKITPFDMATDYAEFNEIYLYAKNHFTIDEFVLQKFIKDLNVKDKPKRRVKLKNNLLLHKIRHDIVGGSYYLYHIRPYTPHQEYNGTMYICLRRPLTDDELTQLSILIKDVLNETAIIRIKKQARSDGWSLLAIDQTHSWKTQFAVLQHHIDDMHASNLQGNQEQFQIHFKEASAKLENIRKINSFNLALVRTNLASSDTDISTEVRNLITTKKVLLGDKILKAASDLRYLINASDFMDGNHYNKVINNVIPVLITQIKLIRPIIIDVIEIALEIVLLDLLKNAVINTDKIDPCVTVYLSEDNELHIVNNGVVTNNLRTIMESTDFSTNGFLNTPGSGVRTTMRYLQLRRFNVSKTGWKLLLGERNEPVDIYIKIPKDDISHEE